MIIVEPLLFITSKIIEFYIWLVIAQVIVSWLIAFSVINTYNKFVSMAADFLYRITEPALRPIRRVLPVLGGIDLSPIALIFGLWFLQLVIQNIRIQLLA